MLYGGSCLLVAFYFDVWLAVVSFLVMLTTETIQFLVARRALWNNNFDTSHLRKLSCAIMLAGTVHVSVVAIMANMVARVNPSEHQTLPLMFLLSSALYGATRYQQLRLTMTLRVTILGLGMVAVAAQDILLLAPPLSSPVWMQFIAVCFMLYLVVDCAQRSRASYVERFFKMRELREARDAARQAHIDKNATIAALTHDLRTPLNAMLGTAQLLDTTDLKPKQSDYAKTIISAGWYLNTLLSDILDAEKLAAGKLSIHPIESDPRALMNEVRNLHAGAARTKGISLSVEVEPDMPAMAMLDPVRVMQAVNNLVSNAIKFTQEGQVSVRASCTAHPDGVALIIEVRDTGIGICEEDAAQLFKPFAQVEVQGSYSYSGSGLGLWISRSLMEAMGGSISLDSTVDEGSCFTLRFVAGEAEAQTPDLAIAV